ncbi:hypothetical protein Misp02_06260 [Microtetraspora sp. NBRC 16547]|nr:hypothetical protein Misp02_06260 [Microtetraspora sp. NBRC 16547]
MRIRKEQALTGFAASPEASVCAVTRYSPGFVLQVEVGSSPLADSLRAYGEATSDKSRAGAPVKTGLSSESTRSPERSLYPPQPSASYRAGDVVVCSQPDGSVPTKLQLAVFLADVSGIQPRDAVVGRIENLGAIQRLVDAVAKQPVSNELLTVQLTTSLVIV